MKKLMFYALCIFLTLGNVGCSEDEKEESTVSVSSSSISFEADGNYQTLSVTSNTSWAVYDIPSWLSVSPSTGNGDASIVLSAVKNDKLESRTCTLNVRTNDNEASGQVVVTQEAMAVSLTVNVTSVTLSAEAGSEQDIAIKANTNWTLSGLPEWLEASSTSGNGDATIKVKAVSFNNSSSSRNATLEIAVAGQSCSVVVTQKAGLAADCTVVPNKIVVLSNGFAFDYTYGSNVSYYYTMYDTKSTVDRYTDAELVEVLEEYGTRDTPSDEYIDGFGSLDPLTEYVILTVAYNKNGERGELVKTDVKTKSDASQAVAFISNVWYDSNYWYFTTTIGGYCSYYYAFLFDGSSHYDTGGYYSDCTIAWVIKDYLDNYEVEPMVQSSNLQDYRTTGATAVHIVTWGVDRNEELAGVIKRFKTSISSSSTNSLNTLQKDESQLNKAGEKGKFEKANINEMKKKIKIIKK